MSDDIGSNWLELLPSVCSKYQIDLPLARAIIMVESHGNQWTTRFEPNWKYLLQTKYFADKLFITQETEKIHQSTSWGLFQIMGTVCRELSYSDHLTKLLIPSINVEYGVKKLAQIKIKHSKIKDIIAAYNAGTPVIDMKTGQYQNQDYVARVLGYFKVYGGVIK